MKIVKIAFALLVFNIIVGITINSSLATVTPTYYEPGYISTFTENGSLPGNVSTISEEQQYTTSMNVFNVIASVVAFDWMYYLIPDELDVHFIPLVAGLDAMMAFLFAVALIELFVKDRSLLGD